MRPTEKPGALVPARDEPRPVEEPEVLSGVEVDRSTGLDDEHRLGRDEDRLRLRNDDHGVRLGSDDDRRPRRWRRADADTDAQGTRGRGGGRAGHRDGGKGNDTPQPGRTLYGKAPSSESQ